VPAVPEHAGALRSQLAYLERTSSFYAERLAGLTASVRGPDDLPALGITAIFGTLSFPAHLAARAREAGLDPFALGLRHLVTAGEPGAGLRAVRREIEDAWGTSVADTFGMSDVWSTMAGECGRGDGLHLTTGGHALVELVDPASDEPVAFEDGPAASSSGPTCGARRPRSFATARATSRPCGRATRSRRRGRAARRGRRRRRGAAPPPARAVPGRGARARDAARRRAQDPHRVPDRPRRHAAAGDRDRPTDRSPTP
jgi:hypothetical protein